VFFGTGSGVESGTAEDSTRVYVRANSPYSNISAQQVSGEHIR
jgi:hypothetical protein